MADKMRVHILAKQLGVQSKEIIAKCKAEGLNVTNHMSTLSAGLEATIREWFSEGQHTTTIETSSPVDLKKARTRQKKKKAAPRVETTETEQTAVAVEERAEPEPSEVSGPAAAELTEVDAPAAARAVAEEAPQTSEEAPSTPVAEGVAPPEVEEKAPAGESAEATAPAVTSEAGPQVEEPSASPPPPEPVEPAGPQNVPRPAKIEGPRVVRYEAPDEHYPRRRPARPKPSSAPEPDTGDAAAAGGRGAETGGRRRGRVRTDRNEPAKKGRTSRRYSSAEVADEKMREWRDRDLAERQERISGATGRRISSHRVSEGQATQRRAEPAPRKTEATVQEPISLKDLCAAIGISMIQLLPFLKREFSLVANANTELTADMAELAALEHGVTLTVLPARSALDELRESFENREPQMLKPRSPVVTFLGHVDHGKTSLLDAIRATHVTEKEDGGITQHIGSYHLKHETAGEVTFLDTPGHAAFTAMRARGARMTDVVVLVVAADDGVMPQTVEAINHAKAAGVPVVVALNKCDLGTQNFNKIYGQLSEHGLAPSGDWGGETDVFPTSAVTGEGIDSLVEHLAALGEVLDLKADYKGDATGVVIEAETKEGVGAVVRVLVQRGVLKTGSVLVCGNAFGKVRALIDDRGKRIKQAGPSIPVEIWGLDEVPAAGDHFYQVKNMQLAKSVAEDVRRQRASESRTETRRLRSLEDVFKRRELGELPELNVIVKADVDGSLDALRNMLEQFPSNEVRLTIRHAAVGPVTDSDVLLADTSDAIVIAFRVTPSTGAKRLADEKGVDVRQYKVIYEVGDEIRMAMEGLLEPEEKVENRATCEVRDVFRITKVGQVAGCFVTDGAVQRNHLVRLIRDGVVVRQGSRIDSLRRFKDDVKEVRAGMECGIRIENFDDIKVGDVIESYEVVKLPRKLAGT